jgi:hypothetical protein
MVSWPSPRIARRQVVRLASAALVFCIAWYALRRYQTEARAREVEVYGLQRADKRRAVQSGQLILPADELSKLFGGFVPAHLQTAETKAAMEVCKFDPIEADTWATIPGGSPNDPLLPCRHWNSTEGKIDCALDGQPAWVSDRDAGKPRGDCSRATFGRPESAWPKRQVGAIVPSTRHPRITIVSALIDIGRYERPRCRYLQYMRPLLRVNASLVLYLEPWAVPAVTAARAYYGLSAQTAIRVVESWEDAPFSNLLPKMREAVDEFYYEHARHGFQNGKVEHEYAEYDWVNHGKV